MPTRYSHSRVETFNYCPFKYRLRYVDGLATIPNTDPDNPLILGTALHTGIEEGVDQALAFYQNGFPILTDEHIHEMMKLESLIPKAAALLPPGGRFEVPVEDNDFTGFIDYLVPVGKGLKLDGLITGEELTDFEAFDLYDFKYTNNSKKYINSGQLHEYKFWFERTHPGCRIRNLYFLFVPKVKIRQKKTETLIQFRDRLREALADAEPWLSPINYDPLKVVDFLISSKHMIETTDFPKSITRLCGWCEYQEYCEKGWDFMLLPKNERRDLTVAEKKVIWVYGAPFSGKTFFANSFPDPLMLNTDGNIKFVDAPYQAIRDTVTVEGRITKRKLAYEVFTETVAELEKKQNDFKTIVVDLLEDVYEACRVYICDRQGWKHESDDSFRAWDMVRSEFLNTLKRLMALDYENIVLISHEDRTRDLTRKGGDKISSIKPNLQDKVANKVAGMVDLVARIVADDSERVLSFKTSEVIFGGGRLTVHNKEIPPDYTAFCAVYEEANQRATRKATRGDDTAAKVNTPPTAEKPDSGEQGRRRRPRKLGDDTEPAASDFTTPAPANVKGGNVQDVKSATDAAPSGCGPDAAKPVFPDTLPWEGDENDPPDPTLPLCPDAARIFQQHNENPEIPLCKNIRDGGGCCKEGGPNGCPLLDKPQAEESAPKMDVNPPRRTRKKRGES